MAYLAAKGFEKNTEVLGNGQCVTLVKALTGGPASSFWKEGSKLDNRPHGNHAAIFVRSVPGGIEIFDQWHRHKPALRTIKFGRPASGVAQRPELYSVVE